MDKLIEKLRALAKGWSKEADFLWSIEYGDEISAAAAASYDRRAAELNLILDQHRDTLIGDLRAALKCLDARSALHRQLGASEIDHAIGSREYGLESGYGGAAKVLGDVLMRHDPEWTKEFFKGVEKRIEEEAKESSL